MTLSLRARLLNGLQRPNKKYGGHRTLDSVVGSVETLLRLRGSVEESAVRVADLDGVFQQLLTFHSETATHSESVAVPPGGTAGYVLKKVSDVDFDCTWLPDLVGTGSGGGIGEAPLDGQDYWRNNAAWLPANWATLDGKPATFPPDAHVHPHSALTGLTDDDHPQYHTDTRGDARYTRLAHTGATGTAHGVATGAVAGFMSAADKAKLDGISPGGSSGTVTTVSVVTANGVSGSVANPTTTPAITLALGALTPTSVAATGAVSGSNLSGTNTGDQTITLTGDVTGTGTGSFAATIANDVVTNAKAANMATSTIKGRTTAGTGDPEDLTPAQAAVTLQGDGLTVDLVGFRGLPQNAQSAAYTLVAADAGKNIHHPSTDANARTFTIPANSSVPYPVGTTLTISNMTSQVVTIAINTDTMYLAGAGTTGNRSLAQYGIATALKLTSTTWLISGPGLT